MRYLKRASPWLSIAALGVALLALVLSAYGRGSPNTPVILVGQTLLPLFIGFAVYVGSPRVRQLLIGPRLVVSIDRPEGVAIPRPERLQYYHLRVVNVRQWAPAERAVVRVNKIYRLSESGEYQDTGDHPLQLQWQYPQHNVRTQPIPVSYLEICDLGFVTDPAIFSIANDFWHLGLAPSENLFVLAHYLYPSKYRGYLTRGGTLRVEIIASAVNYAGKPLLVEVSWPKDREFPTVRKLTR